jgi:iron complex outermembrane recepter protein
MNITSQSVAFRVTRVGLLLPLATFGLAMSPSSQAQDREIFEEIVVTVQRREQNIMDVPVAVSTLTGAQIEEAGIKDMFDLQQNVPGLIVGQSQTATSTNFAIRGIGSTSNNFGVESSVGLYVDDVYRSRQSSLINELVDVESVDVARGPQGTLFGKNTAAGAIMVHTVRPGWERDAFVDVTYGDYDLVKVSAAANIPINDAVAFRGTLFASQRDGYVDDLALGEDIYNDRDREGVRLQLAVNQPTDDFNMRIIADYAQIDEACCVATALVDGLFSRASLTGIPQNGSDAAVLGFGGTVFTDYPYPQPFLDALSVLPGTIVTNTGWDDYVVAYNEKPVSENEDKGISMEINKSFDPGTLTSVTSFRSFDTYDSIDADFTDVNLIGRVNTAEIESYSQEFRFAGDFGSGSSYVVGAYYFGQQINSWTDTVDAGFLSPYIDLTTPELQQLVGGINQVAQLAGPPYMSAAAAFPFGQSFASDVVKQDQKAWAVFGQVDFAVNDQWTLTFGGRYTDETKDIDSSFTQGAQGPAPDLDQMEIILCSLDQSPGGCAETMLPPGFPPANLADPAVYAAFVPFYSDGWGTYLFPPLAPRPDLKDSLQDEQFTGTAKVSWYPNDDMLIYLSYATGYKSGGTNVDRIAPQFSPIFGAETSASIELGMKGQWGPVQVALTLYQTDYDDFQANVFTGTGFNLQNAGKVSTQGEELEVLWRPTESTEVQAFYAHNEGDYDEFLVGTCWDTYLFHTGTTDPGAGAGANDEVCDRTGFPIAYNPEDRAFVAVTQGIDLSGSVSAYVRVEWTYASEQYTDGDLDPFTRQGSVDLINARIGFNFDSWNSNLTLWGRNITDERYFHGTFDAPISAGRMNAYPSEPSTWGITFRKNFD